MEHAASPDGTASPVGIIAQVQWIADHAAAISDAVPGALVQRPAGSPVTKEPAPLRAARPPTSSQPASRRNALPRRGSRSQSATVTAAATGHATVGPLRNVAAFSTRLKLTPPIAQVSAADRIGGTQNRSRRSPNTGGQRDHGGMRVLVTGHRGQVGAPVAAFLRSRGVDVAGFDRREGADLLDVAAVRRAAAGCAAVVHLAALAHDSAGSPEQIMAVNVLGTWHVLLAAERAAAARVIVFSSAQVFGIADGERLPDYFPVDDAHPRRALRPYGLSKRLAEDLCQAFTARTGIPTVALRPVAVWEPARYHQTAQRWRTDPRSEWEPFWEYGAFVDVRDVATAVHAALTVPIAGHHRALLCAASIAATAPALDMAARLAPGVPVTGRARYRAAPWSALIDCETARITFGWQPVHHWPEGTQGEP